MRLKIVFIAALLMLSNVIYATVGGKQSIEFLGYDVRDQKVYLLRHYHDGRGRLPQLYYYDFKTKQTATPIQVDSLYLDPKTGKVDYDNNQIAFEKELAKIKRRLKPLFALNPKAFTINILEEKETTTAAWHDADESVPEYHYRYTVSDKNYHSMQQNSVSYQPSIKIEQAFRIPRQDSIIVTTSYLGIAFETGYTIEDPVLLEKNKK